MVNHDAALVKLAKDNRVVIVADMDHGDPVIPETMRRQLVGMHEQGVRHLFLEYDPKEHTVDEITKHPSALGKMASEAQELGIQVHLYDDRADGIALAQEYPQATLYREQYDNYVRNPQALIAGYHDPEEMREYLGKHGKMVKESIGGRNQIMIENIDDVLRAHPGEKAVVKLGAAHLWDAGDVDEGLRARGHHVTTAEISSPNTSYVSKEMRNHADDKPDIIISGPEGVAISYKEPDTNTMRRALENIDLPWKNTQPIGEVSRSELNTFSAPAQGDSVIEYGDRSNLR